MQRWITWASFGVALLGLGCGSPTGSEGGSITKGGGSGGAAGSAGEGGGGVAGSGGSDAGSGGTGGTAGVAGVGGDGGIGGIGGFGGSGGMAGGGEAGMGSGGEQACAARSLEAENITVEVEETIEEKAPVALYFMLDQSQSMENGDRWGTAVQALTQFVDDPQSQGLDVALQYFPLTWLDVCDGSQHRAPETPMGRLPDHAQAIRSSLSMHAPEGLGTPLEAALRGLVQYCDQDFTPPQSNPEEKCIAVLITDGAPQGCDVNHDNLVNIAANAGSRVFTIGMQGADFNLLNRIAEAGEGDCTPGNPDTWACDASQGSSLAEALLQIRETVTRTVTRTETREEPLECEWKIPEPPEDETFDRDKVNVRFAAEGMDQRDIGRVDDAEACEGVSELAWHYDDPDAPERIVACSNACDAIQSAAGSKIDIVLGCETIKVE